MKRQLIPLFIAGLTTFSSCTLNKMAKLAKEQKLEVNPNPLEVHADSVVFDLSAVLPQKLLKKGFNYSIDPSYKYGEESEKLRSILFKGDDYPDASQSPKLNERLGFAYNPNITNGDLIISGRAIDSRSGKEKKAVDGLSIAQGLITTSTLVENVSSPAFSFHGYNDQEELIPTYVEFFFQQGSPYLNLRATDNSTESKQLKAFVAEKNVTRTVIIKGTHSPEGTERVNSKLSEERAQAVERQYRKLMKRYDYQGVADSINFIVKPIIDNWSEFKNGLNSFDKLTEAQKAELVNIVNGPGSFEEKQDRIAQLPFYKSVILKDFYPTLRNARTEILTVKVKKSNAEIAILAQKIVKGLVEADQLNDNELLWAAHMTPSLDEKAAIYDVLVRRSNAVEAHNNLSAVYIAKAVEATGNKQNRLIERAKTEAELANKIAETPEAYANLANASYLEGNVKGAYELISKALSLNPSTYSSSDIKSTKGALEIRLGKYTEAIKTLNSANQTADNLFNKGLAQLLLKQYSAAVSTLTDATNKNKDFAVAHYATAVAFARQNRESNAVESLKEAIKLSPSLKGKAATDLEFSKISTSQNFLDLIK